MSKDISSALSRVRESARELNQLCDEAAESVRSLEEYLAKECSVGIEAFVVVSSDHAEDHAESMHLCYGRWGGGFRVYLQWMDTRDPFTSSKAWAECRREDKIATLPLLFDLVESIENEIKSRLDKARAAISDIKKLTNSAAAPKPGAQNAKK